MAGIDAPSVSAPRTDRAGAVPPPIVSDLHAGFLRSVLHVVYDAAWLVAALVGSPWLAWKAATAPGFVKMLRERFGGGLADASFAAGGERRSRRVLVHGVSVGEIKTAVPLVESLRARHPDLEFVVSTTTDTGLEVARRFLPDCRVVRFPFDLSRPVRRFLDRVDPACVILVELEIWPNFLRESNRRGVPVAVVNGRIMGQSYDRYKVFRRFMPQFDRISLFCAQGEDYAERFRDLCAAPERVMITGNIKADGLRIGPVDPGEELRELLGGGAGQPVVVAGSTHDPEERFVVEAWRSSFGAARLIVVPRHPPRCPEIRRELAAAGTAVQLLSELRRGERPDPARPVLVDTIGELEGVYGLADLVFVGGSLIPHGGQNMLEPAAQGKPVLFGPHVENFVQEVRLLSDAGACRRVAGPEELGPAVASLLVDEEARGRMSAAGLRAVEAQKGATALTVAALEERCLSALSEA